MAEWGENDDSMMDSELNRPHPMPDTPNLGIATFNVNGIRAARRRGFEDWLAERELDVVALQELRCPAGEVGAFDGYHAAIDCGSIPAALLGAGLVDPTVVAERLPTVEAPFASSVAPARSWLAHQIQQGGRCL